MKKKIDYKNSIILSFMKVVKKMKAFVVRKAIRDMKDIDEGKTNVNRKESREEIEKKVEEFKTIKNPDIKMVIPVIISHELAEPLEKYWPIFEGMKICTKDQFSTLVDRYSKIHEGLKNAQPCDGANTDDETVNDHVVGFLHHILTHKHKQYIDTIKEVKGLLESVNKKINKNKEGRVKKKDVVKEKIESGTYLPKKAYNESREIKLKEKGIVVGAANEKTKKVDAKKKNVIKVKQISKDTPSQKKTGEKEWKKKEGKPLKSPRTLQTDATQTSKPEKPYKKDSTRTSSFDNKKPQSSKSWKDKSAPFSQNNSKTSQYPQPEGPKQLHPSWQAKKDQKEKDMHIKFVQNPIFTFD